MNLSGTWRPVSNLNVGFGYTLSRTRGNYDGETSASGPVAVGPLSYPEYRAESWNYPVGDVSLDQRHKARIHATYAVSPFDVGTLTFGAIQSLNSGTPYGAIGNITIAPYVPAGLNYRGAPASVAYFFTDRDALRALVRHKADSPTSSHACSGCRSASGSDLEMLSRRRLAERRRGGVFLRHSVRVNPQPTRGRGFPIPRDSPRSSKTKAAPRLATRMH